MKRAPLAVTMAVLTTTAFAETPLTPDAFDAATQGLTLFYSVNGTDFGAEEYLPDRRVRWTFLDGECVDGTWYTVGSQICFVYETFEDHQCWSFFEEGGGLVARFENDPDSQPVYQTRISREPLMCLGPKVGV